MTKFVISACTFIAFLYCAAPAFAQDAAEASPHPKDSDLPFLTDNLGGVRSYLLDRGIDVQATYTADFWDNISGGLKRGSTFQDNLDLTIAIDGSKLYGLEGSKAWIYILNNGGGQFNGNRIGSGEGIDNIEVKTQTTKLFEAWVEQRLLERHCVRSCRPLQPEF